MPSSSSRSRSRLISTYRSVIEACACTDSSRPSDKRRADHLRAAAALRHVRQGREALHDLALGTEPVEAALRRAPETASPPPRSSTWIASSSPAALVVARSRNSCSLICSIRLSSLCRRTTVEPTSADRSQRVEKPAHLRRRSRRAASCCSCFRGTRCQTRAPATSSTRCFLQPGTVPPLHALAESRTPDSVPAALPDQRAGCTSAGAGPRPTPAVAMRPLLVFGGHLSGTGTP
jgi:hypothetical protein